MTWSIDTPVRIGPYVFAAIAEVRLSLMSAGATAIGTGEKRPVLILLLHNDVVTAIDILGHAYDADEIEELYPSAEAQLNAMLNDTAL